MAEGVEAAPVVAAADLVVPAAVGVAETTLEALEVGAATLEVAAGPAGPLAKVTPKETASAERADNPALRNPAAAGSGGEETGGC